MLRRNLIAVARMMLVFLLANTGFAEETGDESQPAIVPLKLTAFETALERVSAIAASNDWKDEDWSDQKLEKSLEAIVSQVKKLTNHELLKLPVSFDSVKRPKNANRIRLPGPENILFVAPRASLHEAEDSIILAEESIRIGRARNCIIIARGFVEVESGQRNLILAGHYLHVGYDGAFPNGAGGSVLISGGIIDVAHARDTICCAPEAAEISGHNIQLINAPSREVPNNVSRHRSLTDKTGTLPTTARKHPLMEKLKFTQIVSNQLPQLVVIQTDRGEMVIRVDGKIPNPGNVPDAELEGWRLAYIGRDFALFVKGRDYASVHLPQAR